MLKLFNPRHVSVIDRANVLNMHITINDLAQNLSLVPAKHSFNLNFLIFTSKLNVFIHIMDSISKNHTINSAIQIAKENDTIDVLLDN